MLRKKVTQIARGYLNYLYSPAGQEIAARNFYRPRNAAVLKKYSNVFKPLKLVTIDKENWWLDKSTKPILIMAVFSIKSSRSTAQVNNPTKSHLLITYKARREGHDSLP
jgi:hypothetical protein